MKTKKFLNKEMLDKIIELKNQGLSEKDIANQLGIPRNNVLYHTNASAREKILVRSRTRYNSLSPEEKQAIKDYNKNKYRNDPLFRQKMIEYCANSNKRRYAARRAAGLCANCGKEPSDKSFCNSCLEKLRSKRNDAKNINN